MSRLYHTIRALTLPRLSAALGAPGRRRRSRLAFHEFRELLRLAGPIVLSQLGHIGMNTTDTIMVGPLGAEPLAAAGVGSAVYAFLTMLSVGFLLGMTPLVSQAFGAGDRRRCRSVLVQGLWLATALGLVVTVACALGRPLAFLLGQETGVARLTGGYLRALAWSVAPVFFFMALRQYLEGMGVVKPVTVVTLVGLAVNAVGNAILIYGVPGWIPAFGLVGSGWSTAIVRWVMLAGLAVYVVRSGHLSLSEIEVWRPVRRLLVRILGIGAPIGVQVGMEVGLFSFAAIMMGWLGPVELAAHQVTVNIAATTFMVALGVSLAGSVRVGQHIGAGRTRALRRACAATYGLAIGFMALCALVFLTLPEALIRIFTPEPAIIELGGRLLLVAALFQVFDGAQAAGVSVLRGAADTRTPMIAAAVGYWMIGVPVGYVLAFDTGVGPAGIWIGLSVGLALVAVILVLRVRHLLGQETEPVGAAAGAAAGG